jgi:hypothetical protein
MEAVLFFATYKTVFTIAHVLCVVVGMGGAILADILFAFFAHNKKLASSDAFVLRRISRVVTFALVGVLLTGACLFLSDPEKYLHSAKFLTKMTVVSVLCVNGYLLHRYVFSHLGDARILIAKNTHPWRTAASLMGAVSFVSWVTALSLGVMDALYAAALVVGMCASQVVLKLYERGFLAGRRG